MNRIESNREGSGGDWNVYQNNYEPENKCWMKSQSSKKLQEYAYTCPSNENGLITRLLSLKTVVAEKNNPYTLW